MFTETPAPPLQDTNYSVEIYRNVGRLTEYDSLVALYKAKDKTNLNKLWMSFRALIALELSGSDKLPLWKRHFINNNNTIPSEPEIILRVLADQKSFAIQGKQYMHVYSSNNRLAEFRVFVHEDKTIGKAFYVCVWTQPRAGTTISFMWSKWEGEIEKEKAVRITPKRGQGSKPKKTVNRHPQQLRGRN